MRFYQNANNKIWRLGKLDIKTAFLRGQYFAERPRPIYAIPPGMIANGGQQLLNAVGGFFDLAEGGLPSKAASGFPMHRLHRM